MRSYARSFAVRLRSSFKCLLTSRSRDAQRDVRLRYRSYTFTLVSNDYVRLRVSVLWPVYPRTRSLPNIPLKLEASPSTIRFQLVRRKRVKLEPFDVVAQPQH